MKRGAIKIQTERKVIIKRKRDSERERNTQHHTRAGLPDHQREYRGGRGRSQRKQNLDTQIHKHGQMVMDFFILRNVGVTGNNVINKTKRKRKRKRKEKRWDIQWSTRFHAPQRFFF